MLGMKASAKKFLKSKGIKTIDKEGTLVKLQNAKTVDVVKAAIAKGF